MDNGELRSKLLSRRYDMRPNLSKEEKESIMKQMVKYDFDCKKRNVVVLIEEMAELTQVLSKTLRKCKPIGYLNLNLIEELVDVKICLNMFMFEYGMDSDKINLIAQKEFYDVLNVATKDDITLDTMTAMSDLSKIMVRFIQTDEIDMDNIKIGIIKIKTLIHCIERMHELNLMDMLYVEDIKFERAKSKMERQILA